MQHGLFRFVCKVHFLHDHVAFQLFVGHGTVGAVRMLPGPQAGVLIRFGDFAVDFFRVHQMHIAFVLLRLLIHQFENPLRAGHGHGDEADLLRHLVDGHHKVPAQGQECGDAAQGQRSEAGQAQVGHIADGQCAAHDRQDDVDQVAHVVVHRAENVAQFVGFGGIFGQVVVPAVKLFLRLGLMIEDLDDLLAVHHFFNIPVQGGQGGLLFAEIFRAAAADLHGGFQHHEGSRDHHQRHPHAAAQHGDQHDGQRDHGRDRLRQHLADQLTQGVRVVGVMAHDIAVGMRVKIADRQGLHMREHLVPHLPQHALADHRHDPRLEEIREDRQHVKHCHPQHRMHQGGEIRRRLGKHRRDMIVDHFAQEVGRRRRRHRVQHDEDHHQQQPGPVGLHVSEEALHGVLIHRLMGTHDARAHSSVTHPRRPPSSGIHRLRGRSRSVPAALRAFRYPQPGRCPVRR